MGAVVLYKYLICSIEEPFFREGVACELGQYEESIFAFRRIQQHLSGEVLYVNHVVIFESGGILLNEHFLVPDNAQIPPVKFLEEPLIA